MYIMAVTIGSARSDERGKITGGKAGDQRSGKEVSTQGWYKHGKGWRVFRCKIPEMRPIMADLMQQACDNNNIGYDQYQRTTLTKYLPDAGYIIRKVGNKCETDCSRLVIDIINCALKQLGRSEVIPNGNTSTLPNLLLKSGLFEELKGSKYTKQSNFLMASDILNTKSKGHVVMCITNGDNAEEVIVPEKEYALGERILRNGMEGPDVKELQSLLIYLDYDLGKWGADGDFGDATELAVRFLQQKAGIAVDGEFGPASMKALEAELKVEDGDGVLEKAKYVRIKGGNCFVRSAPTTSKDNQLGVAYEGKLLPYRGETSVDGWLAVEFNSKDGWVSGKYGKLEV
jgi:hypothetical protein